MLGGVVWYGHRPAVRGARWTDEKAAALAAQQAAAEAVQQVKDRADAHYSGAVLAHQAVESRLAAATGRIGGLPHQLRNRSHAGAASG
jgi:hypothetical protein